MSNATPDDGPFRATPIYDATITEPGYDDLLDPAVFSAEPHDDESDTDADEGSAAADRVTQAAGAAKQQAGDVADGAKEAGQRVASTAKDQASRVTTDALAQAKDLYGQATAQLSEQAGQQQQRAVSTLSSFADDLGGMGEQQDGTGLAAQLVQMLSQRSREAADWLGERSPEDVLDEVKQLAARRPGLFLALAAGVGVVGARLTKSLVADAKSSNE